LLQLRKTKSNLEAPKLAIYYKLLGEKDVHQMLEVEKEGDPMEEAR
jgi:hypothetical protein